MTHDGKATVYEGSLPPATVAKESHIKNVCVQ